MADPAATQLLGITSVDVSDVKSSKSASIGGENAGEDGAFAQVLRSQSEPRRGAREGAEEARGTDRSGKELPSKERELAGDTDAAQGVAVSDSPDVDSGRETTDSTASAEANPSSGTDNPEARYGLASAALPSDAQRVSLAPGSLPPGQAGATLETATAQTAAQTSSSGSPGLASADEALTGALSKGEGLAKGANTGATTSTPIVGAELVTQGRNAVAADAGSALAKDTLKSSSLPGAAPLEDDLAAMLKNPNLGGADGQALRDAQAADSSAAQRVASIRGSELRASWSEGLREPNLMAREVGSGSQLAAELRAPTAITADGAAVTNSVTAAPVAQASPGQSPAGASGANALATGSSAGGDLVMQYAPTDPEFADELGARMQVMMRDGMREARLQLNPAELGRLQVTISAEGDQARVVFLADSGVARDAIEQSLPRLREMLEENGLQLAHADVDQRGFQGDGRGAADSDEAFASIDGDGQASSRDLESTTGVQSAAPLSGRIDTYI